MDLENLEITAFSVLENKTKIKTLSKRLEYNKVNLVKQELVMKSQGRYISYLLR